jgi:hypothetical protein
LVFTLALTGTTFSILGFCSAVNSVWRTVWKSFVSLNAALAEIAAPRPVAGEEILQFAGDRS